MRSKRDRIWGRFTGLDCGLGYASTGKGGAPGKWHRNCVDSLVLTLSWPDHASPTAGSYCISRYPGSFRNHVL